MTVIVRTGYADSPDGPVPFRVTVSVFPADRNQFVMDFGMVPGDPAEPAKPPDAMASSRGHTRH